MNHWANFSKGFLKENPIFVWVLGICPALATTTSAINGMGMGLATAFVLTFTNVDISLIAGLIPDKVRIPAYIVVITAFVTIVDLLMAAYINSPGPNGEPSLYDQLGIFIPLIAVNCIVLGRAEAFAAKHKPLPSALDGAGVGLGFAFALTLLGSIREILGDEFRDEFMPTQEYLKRRNPKPQKYNEVWTNIWRGFSLKLCKQVQTGRGSIQVMCVPILTVMSQN